MSPDTDRMGYQVMGYCAAWDTAAGADVYSAVEVVHVSLLPSLMAGPLLERPWAGPHDLPLAPDSHGSTATSSPAYQDPDRL